jgi:hypothetical protein
MWGQLPDDDLAPEHEEPHVRVYPEAYAGEATWAFDPATSTFTMTLSVGPGTHTSSIVVPERLGLRSTDAGVVVHEGTGRANWTVDGPGTFQLRMAP